MKSFMERSSFDNRLSTDHRQSTENSKLLLNRKTKNSVFDSSEFKLPTAPAIRYKSSAIHKRKAGLL